LAAAFSADAGVENDPLQVDGGYVWYEITGTTPARDRTLEEVKGQVEARWRESEIAAKLRAQAAEMLGRLKAGAKLAELAAAEKLTVETKAEIKRGNPSAPLSERTIDVIFGTAKDAYGSAEGAQPLEQIVFRVTDVVLPKVAADSDDQKQLTELLNRGYADDVFGQYLAQIEKLVGVTINQTALRQVITGQSPSDN
jgi:peptidyl-prolyl cis-trans isomerase D